MRIKRVLRWLFLAFPLLCGSITLVGAVSYGVLDHQEKADVVFRDLNILPDIHGGIYEKYFTGDPDNPFNHLVFQMTGIVTTKLCFSGVCVDTVRRIEPILLSTFKTIETPYYGAFAYVGSLSRASRQSILEMAETLRGRAIDYIVMPDEPVSALSENYFQYEDFDDDGIIEDNEITRMRSDAFVEYCYAATGSPIMDADISTVSGAWVLQFRSGAKLLFPSDQQARMASADPTPPFSPRLTAVPHC